LHSPRDYKRGKITGAKTVSGTAGSRTVRSRVIGAGAAHRPHPRVPGRIGRPYGAPIVRTAEAGYAHAMVGMGSVVTRSVPAFALVFGSPARIHGYVCACGHPVASIEDAGKGPLACAKCAERYELAAGTIRPIPR